MKACQSGRRSLWTGALAATAGRSTIARGLLLSRVRPEVVIEKLEAVLEKATLAMSSASAASTRITQRDVVFARVRGRLVMAGSQLQQRVSVGFVGLLVCMVARDCCDCACPAGTKR